MKIRSLLFSRKRSNQNHKTELIQKLLVTFPVKKHTSRKSIWSPHPTHHERTLYSSPSHPPCALFPPTQGWKVWQKGVQCSITSRDREANTSSSKSAPPLEIWALFPLAFLWFQLAVIDSCSGSMWGIKQPWFAASAFSHVRYSHATNTSPLALLSGEHSTQSFKSSAFLFVDYFLWPFMYLVLQLWPLFLIVRKNMGT